ncbi:MAG: CDP-glycerol glycerophosphotransferase family protein [Immundisolibacteraceae bacterium]|nr:CDP-glycerol glycerophosphotransferase family protein [Immundisolibacteraceae bacterium]
MTMPDLHQFQVKRSRHKVHYIYVQHALMSLHMAYRHGAFDHYDTIFCAGPHHVAEIRALENKYGLAAKNLVEHGYSRLDTLIASAKTAHQADTSTNGNSNHVLLAPTWGEQALIESGLALTIIDQCLERGYRITLRPHPQTIKLNPKSIHPILKKHHENPNFVCEDSLISQTSLHQSQIMISDWSGAALEYALGLNKPVLFVDTPKKVNNRHYLDIKLEPFESAIRNQIGQVLSVEIARSHYLKIWV